MTLNWIEATEPIRMKVGARDVIRLSPGIIIAVPQMQVGRLMEQAANRVRPAYPTAPCPRCHQPRFRCETCCRLMGGAWVCSCTHPRRALELGYTSSIRERGAVPGKHDRRKSNMSRDHDAARPAAWEKR